MRKFPTDVGYRQLNAHQSVPYDYERDVDQDQKNIAGRDRLP